MQASGEFGDSGCIRDSEFVITSRSHALPANEAEEDENLVSGLEIEQVSSHKRTVDGFGELQVAGRDGEMDRTQGQVSECVTADDCERQPERVIEDAQVEGRQAIAE